ncbi:MAG TPA: nitroreductase family protein [Firmicutes bacterium]|jgi:nitroreductase|nr:nitroreductase family protein [Bacillota bacterium]
MDLIHTLYTRRSIRKYKMTPVPKEVITKLLEAATLAPSASNSQPWSFVVLQDTQLLKTYSDRAKELCLASIKDKPDPHNYRKILADPDFNIFYNAGTLIIIYGHEGATTFEDCSLAAQNLMLAAHAEGLGTCWIGFSIALLDNQDFKKELGIPQDSTAVAPIIVGYPELVPSSYTRNPPRILLWK